MREEGDDWIDGSGPECIVTQVEFDERSLVFESVTDRGQRGGYFGDKAAGKDICKVRYLFPCRLAPRFSHEPRINTTTHLQDGCFLKKLGQRFGSLDTNGISAKMNLLDDGRIDVFEMGFDV